MESLIENVAATPAGPTEEVGAQLMAAQEQARQAVIEFSGDTVGSYLGMSVEDDTAATHRFLATVPGYQGWQWAVVVAAVPGASRATVSEVVLIPGPTAILAPPWVPWEERVRPGDLGPGDLLAPEPEDPRLVPGFVASGDPLIDDTAQELGFGRRKVLSAFGRDDAAQRWHDGDYGPEAAMARSTKRNCRDCGFLIPLAGALGAMFGVCGNEFSADGHVVDYFYGCGAHSDTPRPAGLGSPTYEAYDDGVLEIVPAEQVAVGTAIEVAVEPAIEPVVEPGETVGESDESSAAASVADSAESAEAAGLY